MKYSYLTILLIFCTNSYAEQINDHCYKFDGVYICEAKKVKVIMEKKIIPKKETNPIIKTYWTQDKNIKFGTASYYTLKSSSNITASGEHYNENDLTCASMDYPFNTILKITNIANNKFVFVRVNDRGNFKKYGRVIDLSKGAFNQIADLKEGLINVKIQIKEK